jgi:prepilin-type N-terminal cleavage/methylation domain-containing protein
MANMRMHKQNSRLGFTLLELMVAMTLGLVVLAAMASLFKTGMNTATMISQRVETQENMRAAIGMLTKDLSLAGEGLPTGGIQLPNGAGSSASKYSCDQTSICHVVNFNYPNGNYMYGIIPGFQNGVENNAVVPAAPAVFSDSITVVYADYTFPLWEYNVYFVAGSNGSDTTVTPNPKFVPAPPAITGAGGIQQGDLILISGPGATAVGEVTQTPGATELKFADADPLNINQSAAASGNLAAVAGGCTVGSPTACTAYRLFVITYYLNVPAPGQTPRLMRQVNGLTPAPVADNIINLQFAYDVDDSGALDTNQPNPLGVLESPNNIQKVNILVMGQSIVQNSRTSQNMYLATSVSARNMTFRNRYQ